MKATRYDYLLKPDGEPHIIDDLGRTCSNGGEYHLWERYYKNDKVYTGHNAQCKDCLNAKTKKRRERQKAELVEANNNPFLKLKSL